VTDAAPDVIPPTGWQREHLASVATILTGHPFRSARFTDEPDEGDLPLVRIRDVPVRRSSTYVRGPIDQEILRRYLVRDGDVLIGMDGQFHVSEWAGGHALLNQRVAKVEFDSSAVHPDFGHYSLFAPIKQAEAAKHYTTVKHLSMRDLRSLEIPLPPLPEQRAIAYVLRTVQRAREQTEQVIAAAAELKKSLMRHLFTYGPTPVDVLGEVDLNEAPEGPTPRHWDSATLGHIANIARGKFSHRPRNDPAFYGGNTPFIQTGDVTRSTGRISRYTQTLNQQGLAVSRVFPVGTIVITIAANIGYTGILEFDSAFPDSLIGITPTDRALPEYLNYYLTTQRGEMDRLAPRGTQKNINIQFLEPWPIPLPPIEEQRLINDALRAVDNKIATEEQRRDALSALFDSLLHNLMTGKLRVDHLAEESGG
jgi:type I restriction enzyme S subunit